MASPFHTLLDATLSHLSELQAAGTRFVEVSPILLEELQRDPHSPNSKPAPTPLRSSPPPPRGPLGPSPAAPVPAPAPKPTTATLPPPPPAPAAATAAPTLATVDPTLALDDLRQRALVCQKCPHLVASRTQVVFGVGDARASLMFVGEAPGADEDRLGEPFVGRAGQLLTKIITAMGYSRSTVYIANILKCRPNLPPGASGNRAPRPEEMDTCKPYLLSQIEIIRPRVIVALGLTAVQGLLGIRTTMGGVRGRWQDFRGIPVMPTFHPSYLLRSEDGPDKGRAEKRKTWEDMLQVLERLQSPISDRMRGFFLKPPTEA